MKWSKIFIFLVVLSPAAKAEEIQSSFYDSIAKRTIYLDSLDLDEVYQKAHDYHYFRYYSDSELMFTYLESKNYFRTDLNDSLQELAHHGTYMTLAHLKMLHHDYSTAQYYLALAEKAPRTKHWCGNAAAAEYAQEEAYILECKLGVATGSEKTKLWNEFLNLAFSHDYFGSPSYAGYGVINYLRAKYTDAEITYLFRKSRETIVAHAKRGEWAHQVEGTLELLGAKANFSFSFDVESSFPKTSEEVKKRAGELLLSELESWFWGY